MSIKDYIINNFKDNSKDEIKDSIEESISSNDEVVLPGLGVLFSIAWDNSDEDLKNKILDILEKKINQ